MSGSDSTRRPARVRSVAAVLAGFAVALGAVFLVGRSARPELAERLEACRTNDCVVEVLTDALLTRGPAETLTAYASIEPDSGGSIDCHDATHRLGERAWSEFGFSAWVGGGNVCNFGFYHGFMVGASENASLEEFTSLAHRLCEESPLPEADLPGPECVHGFGHAVFHLTGTLEGAVERCGAFDDPSFRRRCNEGAVKDGLMVKPDVTEEDFAACARLDREDEGTCVYVTAAYSVVRARDLATAGDVCAPRPEGELRRECEEGLGRGVSMRAVGERFPDPGRWAVEVCGASGDCAEGFGRSVYFIRNDLEWSQGECSALTDVLAARCREGALAAPGSR